METKGKYLQKNGLVLMQITRELMTYSVGERIPTIAEYVEKFKFSRGTVQAAIKFLCEDAIQLDKMGHMGSYLSKISYEKLWQHTGWESLVGVMPVPLTDSLKTLTTAMTACIKKADIPFSLAFMQSASNRIRALETNRFDFVIASMLTAEYCLETSDKLEIAVQLLDDSYCKENVFAFNRQDVREIEDGMRVGYDPDSPDQCMLTQQFCQGKQVTLLPMPYRATLHSLEKEEIDAIIYRLESLEESHRDFNIVPLPDEELKRKGLQAVILTNKENYWMKEMLSKMIDPEFIRTYQKKVESGEMTSYY